MANPSVATNPWFLAFAAIGSVLVGGLQFIVGHNTAKEFGGTPVLGFIANCMGLLGGMVMAWIELDVSPLMFITRLQTSVSVWHYIVGMAKAPIFASG